MFTFSVFDWKYLLEKFGPKNQNCQLELKFRTRLIWICRTVQKICGVHFSSLRPEKPFLDKFALKNQKYQLEQKFGTKTLTWICGIQWWCSLFLFLTINIFLGQTLSKNLKLFVQSEIWYRLILIRKRLWWYLFYLF